MPFRSLGLEPRILQAVQQAGYTEPTPIQTAAIPQVLAGHDLIGIAQTGTGKTAAFTLPILTKLATQPPPAKRGVRVLVVAPTRELVVQIEENVRAYARNLSLRVATVFGGVSEHHQKIALTEGADIVIATPGRLIDLMSRRFGDFSGLQFLVLDEADRMLDMGFLPSIRDIVHRLPRQRQTLMFSATFSKEIETLTYQFQRNPKTVQIGRRADPATTVTQLVYEVRNDLKMNLLLHLLRDPGLNMVLLFSRTKHGADKVARKLEERGIRTGTLHSNRSQNQRLRALKDFKSGSIRVLVATDIAARGIDVDGISHVVNYDFPKHPEDYVHRIGRTGRAHAVGDALSFATPEDHSVLRALERFIGRGLVRKRADGFDYQAVPVRRLETPPNKSSRIEPMNRHSLLPLPRGESRREGEGIVRQPNVHEPARHARQQTAHGRPRHSKNAQWDREPRTAAVSETNRSVLPGTVRGKPPAPRPMAGHHAHTARPQAHQSRHPQAQQPVHRHPHAGSQPSHAHVSPAQDRPQPSHHRSNDHQSRGPRRFQRHAKASKPFWAKR
jgi:ATP-dependent RNA helicase RhlE